MAIHYRVLITTGDLILAQHDQTVYRSFKRARIAQQKAKKALEAGSNQDAILTAHPSKKDAQNITNLLTVKEGDSEPMMLTEDQISYFISSADAMKRRNPRFMNARCRETMRAEFNDIALFGFDSLNRAIKANLYVDISCRWNRSTAPIYIHGRKSNKKVLAKALTA